MNVVADPGLYVLEPVGSRAEPRLFVVYGSEAMLLPIPVVSEQERQDTPVLRVVSES